MLVRRLISALITGVAVIAVACQGGSPDGSSADGPSGAITFQVSGDPEEIVVYKTLVSAFEKQNRNIEVRLVPVADKDDHLAKLTTSFTAGKPPEVFLVNFREYSQFVVRGALEPVAPHLDDMGISTDDYYEQPIEAFTYDGELQCMPQNISSLVVYYNKGLFDQAGLPRPAEGWNWQEFRQTALALTRDGVRGLGVEPNVIRIAPFVWSNGGDIVDDLESPTRFTLEEPEAREALEFIVGLVRRDKVVPTEKEVAAAEDLESMFATGKLGMLLSSRRDTPVFREAPDLDWDVAPLPRAHEPAGILHSDAYCLARDAGNLEAALEFVAFATGSKGQRLTAAGGRTVPSLKQVSTSEAFLDPFQEPAHSRVFIEAIPTIRRTPVLPTWPEIEDVAEEILTRAFYEPGYTVDDALRALDAATRPLFEEAAQQ